MLLPWVGCTCSRQPLAQLLRHDSFVLFSRSLHCCCLLFQNCHSFLKLQLECFMNQLMELVTSDGSFKVMYEKNDLALESMVQGYPHLDLHVPAMPHPLLC